MKTKKRREKYGEKSEEEKTHQKQRRQGRWMMQDSRTVLQAEDEICVFVYATYMSMQFILQMKKCFKSSN